MNTAIAYRQEPKISKEKLFTELGYDPFVEQRLVHDSPARFRVPCCGRRFGKSMLSGKEMTYHMFIPDSYYWIVGPTYPLGEKEFRVVYHDIVMKMKIPKVKKSYNVKQGDMIIEMPWNTILEVKSADKQDTLLGEGLDGAIMSEAAVHKLSTWQMYVEPALSDKRGWALFPSTPRGFNWFQGLWQLGQEEDNPQYESWRFPTWMNTRMFPKGTKDPEILRLKEQCSTAYFAQEYAADFTSFEGQIYPEFDTRIHVKKCEYNENWQNYWVFDFGFSAPFACLDIMVDPAENVYVWREYQVTHKTTGQHGIILMNRENPEGFHVNERFADPRGADEKATLELIMGKIGAKPVPWEDGIEAVKRHLKVQDDGFPKLFIDPSCEDLIRQMQNLRMAETKEGKNPKEGQHDYDDHGPDALRYFFNERFVLAGNRRGLVDMYGEDYKGSEAETFFQYSQEGAFTWH